MHARWSHDNPLHDTPLRQLSGRTVLVTGGADLIGSRIIARLHKVGARPVCLDTAELHDPDLVRKVVGGCDYVVHAAALTDHASCDSRPMAAIDANISGTQLLLDAVSAVEQVRRFVFASSAEVYGDGSTDGSAHPSEEYRDMRQLLTAVYGRVPPRFHERSELRPTSVYGNTKAWGETQTALTLKALHTSYTVLRYFCVYGEPQAVERDNRAGVVPWFAARASLGLPLHLPGGGNQIRDLVHVEDAAEATVRALVAPRAHNETLNIGTGVPTSIRTVAELISEHYPVTRFVETLMPPGDAPGGYATTHRVQAVLGWLPSITVEEGIARYTTWLRRNPQAVPASLHAESRPVTA